jgi:hypothetical protein
LCVPSTNQSISVDIGVMSGAAMYIKKDLKITDVQLETLMASLDGVYVIETPHKNSVSMILRALYSHETVLEYN